MNVGAKAMPLIMSMLQVFTKEPLDPVAVILGFRMERQRYKVAEILKAPVLQGTHLMY